MEAHNAEEVVTLLIRHRVRQGQDEAYEHWLRRIVKAAHGYPGHLGVDVIRSQEGGLQLFTSVLRFAGAAQLQHWLGSDERRQLLEEVSPLLDSDEDLELHPSREFWFTPTPVGNRPPPRWKQACVTFAVILPLSLLVPLLWQPLFAALPWLGGHLASNVLITLTIVLLVVYLFMPRVTRWCAGWLNRS
ncbi:MULTISPECIES: antibiotic biosynthesis monooxygenase [unclassified Pseudomonas]|uniref:antibiotic biosynthesis monooxygenase n=1 Tax=unclassified Pseudomonas TaxID=196821 RepID=UPI00244BCCF8|nr:MULTISPECIES: antibiotic biosynthesis monooxygenase [unclassified Pseudomonas]MDG9923619.1 antibiotic biosynthesis monooxygenase [Pseudomonas sp. GD04045]MDH0036381.1 antibiotic biosynthesis monooxygenase [Pseudomonas sp. GD04019]